MKFFTSTPKRPDKLRVRAGIIAIAAATAIGTAISANAATTSTPTGPFDILLGVGTNQTERNVTWYYPSGAAQSLEIEKKSDLATGGAFDSDKTVIAATSTANTAADTTNSNSSTSSLGATTQAGYYNAKARITGLASNTTYVYHVGTADGSNWSASYEITTGDLTKNAFDFLFFGDPQIGSSGYTDDDAAGWAATLDYATSHDTDAELLVSGGDQVENANNEYQWSAFADSSSILKRYPWAATIGNHDVGGKAYSQHNYVPNNSAWSALYKSGTTTADESGGDYWFMYKNVLFIDLNSNAYAGSADAEHVSYVTDIVNRYGSKAKWKVLVYHHSIYSPADHANDIDNQQRRADFTTAFSKLGINLVLQGHDHSYSRSYAILNGAKANPDETAGQPEVYSGPGGVIYVTANSSSGSKYYELSEPDDSQGGYGADPTDSLDTSYTGDTRRHWANSVEDQEYVRTYTRVKVADDKLSVDTIRAGDCSDTSTNSAVKHNTTGIKNACGSPGVGKNPISGTTYTNAAVAAGTVVDGFKLDRLQPTSATAVTLSASSTSIGAKTPVTVTAAVSGGLGTLSGSVTFYDGTKSLGTSTLSAGQASVTLPTSLSAGSHSITAKFSSDSVYSSGDSVSPATVLTVKAGTISIRSAARITGTAKVGRTLKAANPTTSVGGVTYRYQWLRNGSAISGATGSSRRLTSADRGKRIAVKVTVSRSGYASAVSTSRSTSAVAR